MEIRIFSLFFSHEIFLWIELINSFDNRWFFLISKQQKEKFQFRARFQTIISD